MAPSYVLAIYSSLSSIRQKEENSYASGVKLRFDEKNTASSDVSSFAIIDFQLGVSSPSPKTEHLLLKRCPHIRQVYLVVEKQEQHQEQHT